MVFPTAQNVTNTVPVI